MRGLEEHFRMRSSLKNLAVKENLAKLSGQIKWDVALDIVADAVEFNKAVLVPLSQRKASIDRTGKCHASNSEIAVMNCWRRCHLDTQRFSELSRKAVIETADYRNPEECSGCSSYPTPYCEQVFECGNFPWFTGVKVNAFDEPWCLVLERSAEKGPFSTTELERLGQLSSRLSTVASEIHSIGIGQAEAILAILEILEMPAAWVDQCGYIQKMNQEAERLFRGDDVTCCQGKVVCSNRAVGQELNQKLFEFVSANRPPGCCMPFVPISQADNRHPLLVSALRLDSVSQDKFSRYKAILTFTDLDKIANLSQDDLCRVFHLTSAEARLAVGLAGGKSLDALAKEFCIKKDTARHELKSVFSKLDVHRQSELVGLLSRSVPRTKF